MASFFVFFIANLKNRLVSYTITTSRSATQTVLLGNSMKRTHIYPDQFAHQIFTSVNFSGMNRAVIVAFDDPNDSFIFLADSLYNITYDLNPSESMRMTNLANEMMEQA